jgi:amino acid transporter
MENWEFAGWGKAQRITNLPESVSEPEVTHTPTHKLGQLPATAICGNDITSSCLYVAALSTIAAGAYAPVALLVVALVLFFFRKIYSEVGSALPMNGGTYSVLLNTTNKKLAAAAACLTLLSYIATAVISAGEAMHYLHALWHGLNVVWATIILLAVFAFLNIMGMKESAVVAVGIFIIHMATLSILVIACGYFVIQNPDILFQNFDNPLPSGKGLTKALYLGFASAMLGISGFESSANFIEEQKEGVFPKTLRNMWIAVSIFNPLIAFLALGVIPHEQVAEHKTSLLAHMGEVSVGEWLKVLVSIDAVLVLSGAVLTSFVGVTGLVRRMSLDSCLPQLFLSENRFRRTNHWIIIAFFVLCCGILFITNAEVEILAGVYTISFLCVMALFAVGNMLMKRKRAKLPRKERAAWPAVIFALVAVMIGLSGNMQAEKVEIFTIFFVVMGAVVAVMFLRISILRLGIFMLQGIMTRFQKFNDMMSSYVLRKIDEINGRSVVFFTKGDNIATLNRAALYVLENETTDNLMVVNIYQKESDIPPTLAAHLRMIDHLYPQLRIDFLAVKGAFGPDIIGRLSKRLNVPRNYMFIGTPGDRFPHELSSLGGVRLIIE